MHPAELADLLTSVERPGKFYAAGAAEIYLPSLQVEGVGPVAFPLLPFQAAQLVAVAEQAPYGKGPDTLVDTAVRRTWQIDAEKIHIQGKYWAQNLGEIIDWIKPRLGVAGPVQAELYKLLVYDTGSFFVSHRDTEKAPGMFATLVVILPSLYEGGELVVRHLGEEARLSLNGAGPSEVAFAAFYADCLHEVLPVTSGCRLALVYTLARQGQGGAPLPPPDYRDARDKLAGWLRRWGETPAAPGGPLKLIHPLEHAYTEAELAFDALKGADASRAAVAVAAAAEAGCDVFLALVTIEEGGYAEHDYDYWSRGRRWRRGEEEDEDEGEFSIGEVTEREQVLCEWRSPGGGEPPLERLPFDEDELTDPDAFAGLEPDELYFQEATGNAGASFERTYRRAALVFWPRGRRFAVLGQGGLDAMLPWLEELAERWAESGADPASPLRREASELAGQIIQSWPARNEFYRRYDDDPGQGAALLETLGCLQDAARIDQFLAGAVAAGDYGLGDNPAIAKALALLPPARAAELARQIVAANAAKQPAACANLLPRCAALLDPADLAPAALALLDALPGDPKAPPTEPWRIPTVKPILVVDLMAGLELIDPGLAGRAAEILLARPAAFGFDAVLVPALLQMDAQAGAAAARLRAACLDHLARRIAEPLDPPADWTRPAALTCHCRHCGDLAQFLADPDRPGWSLKAVQQERTHVEQTIRDSLADLDCRTEKRGSPHTLVCAKNQASYQRRVIQRGQDLQNQAALRQASARFQTP